MDLSEEQLKDLKDYIEQLKEEEKDNRQHYNVSEKQAQKSLFDQIFNR
jgi:hypothetical protein